MSKIKVVLADSVRIFREAISLTISTETDMEVIGLARDTKEILKLVETVSPDVVVMDIDISGGSFKAARKIKEVRPKIMVVFLTMYDSVDCLVDALAAGGNSYVLKNGPLAELLSTIREVMSGGLFVSSPLLTRWINCLRGEEEQLKDQYQPFLTDREREVLRMFAEGRSKEQIAKDIHTSVGTVEVHRNNIMRKLAVHNQFQLVQYALREGFTSLAVSA